MTKLEVIGIIFIFIFAMALLYTIYGMWEKYSIESLEPAITTVLVSAGIAGLCLYSGKPKT